jgi:hypothetical protein
LVGNGYKVVPLAVRLSHGAPPSPLPPAKECKTL